MLVVKRVMCTCVHAGGYKGYGLAMLVEILCGIMADADYGSNIRKWRNTDRIANLVTITYEEIEVN